MNIETLTKLANGENLEIEVKVGNKTYPTARDYVELEEGKFIVNVSVPVVNTSNTPIEDSEILEKLKALGFQEDKPTIESSLCFLRSEKKVYLYIESGFQRIGAFSGGGQIVHRGNIALEERLQTLTLDTIFRDYNVALLETLRKSLEILCN